MRIAYWGQRDKRPMSTSAGTTSEGARTLELQAMDIDEAAVHDAQTLRRTLRLLEPQQYFETLCAPEVLALAARKRLWPLSRRTSADVRSPSRPKATEDCPSSPARGVRSPCDETA